MEASWALLGLSLGRLRAFLGHLGPPWGSLGPSWGHFAPHWGYLVPSWPFCEPTSVHIGLIWGLLGAILGLSWGCFGAICGATPHPFKRGRRQTAEPANLLGLRKCPQYRRDPIGRLCDRRYPIGGLCVVIDSGCASALSNSVALQVDFV